MSAKNDVIEAVKSKLGGAEDNLYRFRAQARSMKPSQIEKEWAHSGRKFSEFLTGAQAEVDRWTAALKSLQ